MISGKTTLIAHIGYPTESFKAPLIYNPWFEGAGIDAVVVPMGVKAEDYPTSLKALFRLANMRGALITMPHKVTTVALLDERTTAVEIAGLVQRDSEASRRDAHRRHVRRHRIHPWPAAQGISRSQARGASWSAPAAWDRRLPRRWLPMASRSIALSDTERCFCEGSPRGCGRIIRSSTCASCRTIRRVTTWS